MKNGAAYFNLWQEGEFVGRTSNLDTALQFQNRHLSHSVEFVYSGNVDRCIESLTIAPDAQLSCIAYKDVAKRGGDKYNPAGMLRACKVAIRPDIHIVDYDTGRVVTNAGTARYVRAAAWFDLCDYFKRNDYHHLYR